MKLTGKLQWKNDEADPTLGWWELVIDGGDAFPAHVTVPCDNLWAGYGERRISIEVSELEEERDVAV